MFGVSVSVFGAGGALAETPCTQSSVIRSDGVTQATIECRWSDVDLATFARALARFDRYADYFWPVLEVRVIRIDGPRTLLWQRLGVPGMSPRENLVWIQRTGPPEHPVFVWRVAHDVPFVPSEGSILAAVNDGDWSARVDGNDLVVSHSVAFDPAGWIPGFVVDLTTGPGMQREIDELHTRLRVLSRRPTETTRPPTKIAPAPRRRDFPAVPGEPARSP